VSVIRGVNSFRTSCPHAASASHRSFHARLDTEIFGDALDDHAQIARGGVASTVQHPVERLFAKTGLPRQLFERDFGVDQIAQA